MVCTLSRMSIYILLSASFFGIGMILLKVSSTQIHPILSNLVVSIAAGLVQLMVLVLLRWKHIPTPATMSGVWWSCAAGLFIGLYTSSLLISLSTNDASKVVPLIYTSGLVITAILGAIILKEQFHWINGLGVMFSVVAIWLLMK